MLEIFKEILDDKPLKKIIVRGFNERCKVLCDELVLAGRPPVAIMDRDAKFIGTKYRGVSIVSPQDLPRYSRHIYIVMITTIEPIVRELNEAGISPENILIFGECQWVYVQRKNNEGNHETAIYEENIKKLELERFVKEETTAMPCSVTIETSTKCNLNCVMCYYFDENNKKDRDANSICLYTPESFEFLLPTAKEIFLQIGGEPLMSHLFWDFLVFIKERKSDAYLAYKTNGVLLNKDNIERIMESSTSLISISLDAATPQTYMRIRGYDFEKVVNNIRNLIAAKERMEKTDLTVSINMTVMRENVEELERFVKLAKELGTDYAEVWPINFKDDEKDWRVKKGDFIYFYYQQELRFYPNLTNAMLKSAQDTAKRRGVNFFVRSPLTHELAFHDIEYPMDPDSFIEAAAAYSAKRVRYEGNTKMPVNSSCADPWDKVFIYANGDVKPCCYLHVAFGNIYSQTYKEIWNSPIAKNIRKGIINGRLNALCHATNCPYARAEESRDILPLNYNTSVSFEVEDNNSRDFIECRGLSFPEQGGTWFCGKSASITYRNAKKEAHTLVIEWAPFIIPAFCNEQRVHISTGKNYWEMSIAKQKKVKTRLVIIGEDYVGDTVSLYFDFLDSLSPKQLGLNTDMRRLSFQLTGLSITPEIEE